MNILLIGQPNVGKSSIFNVLSEKNNIIHKTEGTTRDWHFSKVIGLNSIFIYDTPGIIVKKNTVDLIEFKILLDKIDLFLYVID